MPIGWGLGNFGWGQQKSQKIGWGFGGDNKKNFLGGDEKKGGPPVPPPTVENPDDIHLQIVRIVRSKTNIIPYHPELKL